MYNKRMKDLISEIVNQNLSVGEGLSILSELARYKKEGKPEFSIENQLLKMAGDSDLTNVEYFFRFDHAKFAGKVGTNPNYDREDFGTPMGIYFYPLTKTVVKDLLSGDQASQWYSFAYQRRFITVVKIKDRSKILIVSKYTKDDLARDVEKLREKGMVDPLKDYEEDDRYFNRPRNVSPFRALFKMKDKMPDSHRNRSSMHRKMFVTLGYDGIFDDGKWDFTTDIPSQAVFFSTKPIKHIATFPNPLLAGGKPSKNPNSYSSDVQSKQSLLFNQIDKNPKAQEQLKKLETNSRLFKYWDNATKLHILNKKSKRDFISDE